MRMGKDAAGKTGTTGHHGPPRATTGTTGTTAMLLHVHWGRARNDPVPVSYAVPPYDGVTNCPHRTLPRIPAWAQYSSAAGAESTVRVFRGSRSHPDDYIPGIVILGIGTESIFDAK